MITPQLKEKLTGLIFDAVDENWILCSKPRIPVSMDSSSIDWDMVSTHLTLELVEELCATHLQEIKAKAIEDAVNHNYPPNAIYTAQMAGHVGMVTSTLLNYANNLRNS